MISVILIFLTALVPSGLPSPFTYWYPEVVLNFQFSFLRSDHFVLLNLALKWTTPDKYNEVQHSFPELSSKSKTMLGVL